MAIVIFVYHARLAYKSGSVAKYIGGYISTFALIAMADALLGPQFEFHLHHSFIAALLWPATLFKTWFSVFIQAALLGILLNGIMLWGWGGDIFDFSPSTAARQTARTPCCASPAPPSLPTALQTLPLPGIRRTMCPTKLLGLDCI